jgi:hypothetical protein
MLCIWPDNCAICVISAGVPNRGPCPYGLCGQSMSLSGPSLLQNAISMSRRSVSQDGNETFPNWVSQSVQTALNPKTVRPNPQTPRPRPDRPKVGADVEFGTLPRIPSGSYPRSQFYFPFKILERTSKKLRSQAQTAQKCQAILWDLGDSRTRRFQSQKS